ncbi:MAG TPA: mechanosensitive ion channel family protein [Anaeromyxobacteraceae bacterium]|nr:mechanosensitive ion channel family protein [Anaeromyxobacteraceae bacterium]
MRILPLILLATPRPWFEQHLPPQLLEEGPRGLLWWQLLAVPLAILIAWLGGKLLGWITRRVLGHLSARTETTWDDILLERLAAPFTAFWSLVVAYALLPWLALDPGPRAGVERLLHTGTFVVFFWGAVRSIDIGFKLIGSWPFARANPLAAGMLPLGSKIARVAVVVIGVIAILTQLGYPVASLIAGLGIGGLALALAAQKTVENLFGSVAISVDQPCRIGDFVKIEGGLSGSVEAIGLRSTRIRTLDRTLVTVPNGKLSDARIETFGARDKIRFFATLQLEYGTTAEQMRAVLAGFQRALESEPKIEPGSVVVRFVNLGATSLDVEVIGVFLTADFGEFTAIRQELLLRLMEVVERAGARFAFPTQTLHLASVPRGLTPGDPNR